MEWLISNTLQFSLNDALIAVGSALLLGVIISFVFQFVSKGVFYKEYQFTIMLLPMLIAMLIYLINNNVATAFSLAGAFSLIRFRSEAGSPSQILYIFFAVVIGLACGLGHAAYGAIFTIIISIIMLGLAKFYTNNLILLEITVPENVDFTTLFDETMQKYTQKYDLVNVKTKEFGSLFQLNYNVQLKNVNQVKAFIDEIRVLNSNLNVKMNFTKK